MTNGNIFDRVIGFSPGGVLSPGPVGKPAIFLSAGNDDDTYGEPADKVAASVSCQLRGQGALSAAAAAAAANAAAPSAQPRARCRHCWAAGWCSQACSAFLAHGC